MQVRIGFARAGNLRGHAGIAGSDVDVRDRRTVLGEHQILVTARIHDLAARGNLRRDQGHAVEQGRILNALRGTTVIDV